MLRPSSPDYAEIKLIGISVFSNQHKIKIRKYHFLYQCTCIRKIIVIKLCNPYNLKNKKTTFITIFYSVQTFSETIFSFPEDSWQSHPA